MLRNSTSFPVQLVKASFQCLLSCLFPLLFVCYCLLLLISDILCKPLILQRST
nr:MAG TPA: hypothetical protein [Caudoviricetes sp.]